MLDGPCPMMRTTLVDLSHDTLNAAAPGIVREVTAGAPEAPEEPRVLGDRDPAAATVSVVVVRRDPDRDRVPDLAVI